MAEQQFRENLTPPHPYELVDMDGRRTLLRAVSDGTEFQIPSTVGRIMLILEVGMEREKNRAEISRELYGAESNRIITPSNMMAKLVVARKATVDVGPPIITQQGGFGTDATYYYEGTSPEERAGDFEAWDDGLTHIRFDKRTAYLTISYNGMRSGSRVGGHVKKTLLEHLLAHPNEELTTDTLYKALQDTGHHGNKMGIGRNISAFRTYIQRHHGIDPSVLLQSHKKMTRQGAQGIYTLLAHTVEVVDEDGSKRVVKIIEDDESKQEAEEALSWNCDASLIALGLLLKRGSVQETLSPALQQKWPKDTELLALSEAWMPAATDSRSARQVVESDTLKSLERVKGFLDQPDIEEVIRQWSPENGAVKSLVVFLAQVDKMRFVVQYQSVRGLDALKYMFSASLHKLHQG